MFRQAARRLGGVRRFCDGPGQKTFNKEYASKGSTGVGQNTRQAGQGSRFIYNNFLRSTTGYATCIVGLAIVGDIMFDKAFDGFWAAANKGKSFDEVIPTRFPNLPPGCEDDEDEEDE